MANSSMSSLAIQRGGPPKDGIPGTDRSKISSAAQGRLADGDSVLGVALDGITRAYPVHIFSWQEAINGHLGERTVASTRCTMCGTGMPFETRVDEGTLKFGVSGLKMEFRTPSFLSLSNPNAAGQGQNTAPDALESVFEGGTDLLSVDSAGKPRLSLAPAADLPLSPGRFHWSCNRSDEANSSGPGRRGRLNGQPLAQQTNCSQAR